jgi:hypothetical protein
LSKRDFVGDFRPPDYLVDGLLQRRFVYSLTAATGHGKTAVALRLAQLVSSSSRGALFGPHAVDKGSVVYFAGENSDDLRMRVIADDAQSNVVDLNDHMHFIPGTFNVEQMHARLQAETERLGGVDLVVVDTSAAYFLGNDEISNTQMGNHARMLRKLTTLPGGPCVLILCHPIKHASEPSQLLPRGGGAFLAEVDGNLTLWKHNEAQVELSHTDKFRGPGFEPISFRLEKITCDALVDTKGRRIPTVRAVPMSESDSERAAHAARADEDRLLHELTIDPNRSIAQLANACGWKLHNGDPHKSKVDRVMKRLKEAGLVRKHRDIWRITEAGKKAA